MKRPFLVLLFGFVASVLASCNSCPPPPPSSSTPPSTPPPFAMVEKPIEVKVLVCTTFEIGADLGDKIGEYQPWVEGEKLTTVISSPVAFHALRTNGSGLYATYSGMGGCRSASSMMAIGLDPRFDFSKAYIIVGGIAGGNPRLTSLGSAVWARYVVSSDLAHYIDPREAPKDWKSGFFPLDQVTPNLEMKSDKGYNTEADSLVFPLNPKLVTWAFNLSKSTPLIDDEPMKINRARFKGYPNAQLPPQIQIGDTVSGNVYFHGKLMSTWASDWVKEWTRGQGQYYTTAMEDVGFMQALTWLAKAGKIDHNRVLVLRTVSNYDEQAPGMTAAESIMQEAHGYYSGYQPSCRAHYLVGSKVADEIIAHWAKYRDDIPGQ